jgi:hypothetical protein
MAAVFARMLARVDSSTEPYGVADVRAEAASPEYRYVLAARTD